MVGGRKKGTKTKYSCKVEFMNIEEEWGGKGKVE
jgi:hypothetical protein